MEFYLSKNFTDFPHGKRRVRDMNKSQYCRIEYGTHHGL